MGAWSDYALSDFLMFAPETYFRLFERINATFWPVATVALTALLLLIGLARHRSVMAARSLYLLLAAVWAWVAWAFLYRLYAPINLAAVWFAMAFVIQALLLMWSGVRTSAAPQLRIHLPGLLLLVYALLVHPVIVVVGRGWQGIELFGLAPDATALVTLAILLMSVGARSAVLVVIPLLWCLVSGLTYWAMGLAYGALTPLAAISATVVTVWLRRPSHATTT